MSFETKRQIASGGGGGSIAIGDAVSGGTPTEVLYVDNSGNLFSDSNFTRDPSTQATNILTDFDLATGGLTDVIGGYQSGLLLGVFPGVGHILTTPSDPNHIAINITSIGGPSALPSGWLGGGVNDNGFFLGTMGAGLYDDTDNNAYFEATAQDIGNFRHTIEARENRFRIRADGAEFMLEENAIGGIRLQTSSLATNYWRLPTQSGPATYVLTSQGDGATATWEPAGGGGTPGGSDGQLQWNNASTFSGVTSFTYNSSIDALESTGQDNLYMTTSTNAGVYWFGAFNSGRQFNNIKLQNRGLEYVSTYLDYNPTPTFTGSGLNDMQFYAPNFEALIGFTYTITVAANGTPDTFDWTDGTNSGIGVPMSTTSITLSNGVTVVWASDTGHTIGDQWTFTINPVNLTPVTYQNQLNQNRVYIGDFTNGQTGFKTYWGLNEAKMTTIDSFANRFLEIDKASDYYAIGDIDAFSSSVKLVLSGATSQTGALVAGNNITIGDLTNYANGTRMEISSEFAFITLKSNGNRFLSLEGDPSQLLFALGDIDSLGLGTRIEVDAVNGSINLASSIIKTALPAYADDSGAGTAGLLAGDLYQTDGSGAAPLNVAGIVMVKQ